MTPGRSLMDVRDAIAQAQVCIPRRDAETLLLHVLREGHRDRAWLLAHPEAVLSPEELAHFDLLVSRRAAHEPLQYLTGRQEFYGLDLHVTPHVLIPRPETELLVEAALTWAQSHTRAHERARWIDVGTGSGAIALALAAHLPSAEITALDLSSAALSVAEENAARLGLSGRVQFDVSDLLTAVGPSLAGRLTFDAVVSNPPYVPSVDAPSLQAEVREYEPHLALIAGADGLAIYRRLIPQAMEALRPGGLLAMEFGYGQHASLAALLPLWKGVRFLDDLAGIPRVVLAERP